MLERGEERTVKQLKRARNIFGFIVIALFAIAAFSIYKGWGIGATLAIILGLIVTPVFLIFRSSVKRGLITGIDNVHAQLRDAVVKRQWRMARVWAKRALDEIQKAEVSTEAASAVAGDRRPVPAEIAAVGLAIMVGADEREDRARLMLSAWVERAEGVASKMPGSQALLRTARELGTSTGTVDRYRAAARQYADLVAPDDANLN